MRQRLTTLACLLLTFSLTAQTNPTIDALFEEWDNTQRPGVAALMLHKGEVIYSTALGSADLEHQIPITLDTKFQLAGLSKHFVAFGILLLESQNQLSLEDDIRKHIPEMPSYGQVIRIRHLLSHSSGLNDYWEVKNLLGWTDASPFTHQDALKLIFSQATLAFDPGSDYIYGNTEQTLLAEIISRVSGRPFVQYMRTQIFEPLGMNNTLFKESVNQNISGVAKAYRETEGEFRPVISNYVNPGPTNLYASVNDLAKWESNLASETPIIGTSTMFQRLNAAAKLDDGSTMDPVFGRPTMGQQLLHNERGLLNIYQTGNLGGYTSSIFKFLNEEFTVIVLSNSGLQYTGYLGMRSAYHYLADEFQAPATVDFDQLPTKQISQQQLRSYAGHYWNDRASYSRGIVLIEDTLRYSRGPGNASPILPLGQGRFQMMSEGDESLLLNFSVENGQEKMELTIGESAPIVSTKYTPKAYSLSELKQFEGTYYAKEFSHSIELKIENGVLKAKNLRVNDAELVPITKDLFTSDQWALSGLYFDRNDELSITGFELNTEQMKKIWFSKLTVLDR